MKKKNNNPLYPSITDGEIPAFKTYEEEANFWDTHSVTDFENQTKDVEIIFELDKPRDESLVLRVQKPFKNQLKKIARNKGLDVSTLARMWLMEKTNETLRAVNG